MSARLAARALGAFVALGLTGCASALGPTITVTPDYGSMDTDLKADYVKTLGAPVDHVACSGAAEVKVNERIHCRVYVGDRSFSVEAWYTAADLKSGGVAYTYKISTGVFVDVKKVQGDIEATVAQRKPLTVKADCGPQLLKIVDVGDTFSCVITATDGRQAPVAATVTDKDGGVDFHINLGLLAKP